MEWGNSSAEIRIFGIGKTGKMSSQAVARLKVQHDSIVSALKKAPVHKKEIYRGLQHLTDKEIKDYTSVGSTVKLKTLSSWTKDKNIARSFSGEVRGERQGVIFRTIPKKRGTALKNLVHSDYMEEKEVLTTGGKYVVRGAKLERFKGQPGKTWVVNLEEM